MAQIYTSPTKNFLQRNGFVMVSNLLITYQQELGISDVELAFIIKIMKNRNGYVIHDTELDPTVSSRTMSRRRSELKSKGYLNYSIIKKQDMETGLFITEGITYDLSPLEEKLQIISDKLEEEKTIKETKKIKEEKKIVVEEEKDEPLQKYLNDYEEFYGIPYNINDFEMKKYNELSDDNKKCIAYIFDYCKDNDLLGKIVPRLSLFFKTKFRFFELKKYYETNNSEQFETFLSDTEQIDKLTKEIYNKYYKDEKYNYPFYKAVERIVGRYIKDGQIPECVYKLIDKSYEDTYTNGLGENK